MSDYSLFETGTLKEWRRILNNVYFKIECPTGVDRDIDCCDCCMREVCRAIEKIKRNIDVELKWRETQE